MIPDKLFDDLCAGAREAVLQAFASATALPAGPDEIDHIYAMTSTGVSKLGALWGPLFGARGLSLRITGVFCHQTPKAHFTHPTMGAKSPELADLLFVHDHQQIAPTGQLQTTRRAVLVQAKMTTNGVPSSIDPVQEWLYENWPQFELKGRGPSGQRFVPGLRNISPNDGGSRYGLIADRTPPHTVPVSFPFCCGFPWSFADPRDVIRTAGGEDTGAFLASMLYDTRWPRGRSAVIPASLSLTSSLHNHFDVTVEELLTITAEKTLRFKRKAHITGKRGNPVLACFQVQQGPDALLPSTGASFVPSDVAPSVSGDGGMDLRPPDEEEMEFDDGISLVLLETGAERSG